MISRVADHCFWFGRYLERAESAARVLRVTSHLALDSELAPAQCWMPVIIVSGEQRAFLERFGSPAAADGEVVQTFLTWDEDNLASIRRSIGALRSNARSIREVLSSETWESVNELHLWIENPNTRALFDEHRETFYRRLQRSTQLVVGTLHSTMLHDEAYDYIWLGVMLERISQTARILDVQHHAMAPTEAHHVVETSVWMSLLQACSGVEPFMQRYSGRVSGECVARFLLFEPSFPRSVAHAVRLCRELLCALRPPQEDWLPGRASLERLFALEGWLQAQARQPLVGARVHEVLTHCVDESAAICSTMAEELFGYGGTAQAKPVARTAASTFGRSSATQSEAAA